MRRTHILHHRDNRRPHFFAQRDHRDSRPVIAWLREGEKQILTLDGLQVARVEPLGAEHGWDSTWSQPREGRHDAIILHGPHAGERRPFPDDCDSARLWAESVFAAAA